MTGPYNRTVKSSTRQIREEQNITGRSTKTRREIRGNCEDFKGDAALGAARESWRYEESRSAEEERVGDSLLPSHWWFRGHVHPTQRPSRRGSNDHFSFSSYHFHCTISLSNLGSTECNIRPWCCGGSAVLWVLICRRMRYCLLKPAEIEINAPGALVVILIGKTFPAPSVRRPSLRNLSSNKRDFFLNGFIQYWLFGIQMFE